MQYYRHEVVAERATFARQKGVKSESRNLVLGEVTARAPRDYGSLKGGSKRP